MFDDAAGAETISIAIVLFAAAGLFSGPFPVALFKLLSTVTKNSSPTLGQFALAGTQAFVLAVALMAPFFVAMLAWELAMIFTNRLFASRLSAGSISCARSAVLIGVLWLTLIILQTEVCSRAFESILRFPV